MLSVRLSSVISEFQWRRRDGQLRAAERADVQQRDVDRRRVRRVLQPHAVFGGAIETISGQWWRKTLGHRGQGREDRLYNVPDDAFMK